MMALVLVLVIASAYGSTEAVSVILPGSVTIIEEEAFVGDSSMTSIVIPKNVESIGKRAFQGCDGLMEVYFGKNTSISIAPDAFDKSTEAVFYVYPDTPAEQYALAHGFNCETVEEGSSALQKAMALVANNGGSSILQSNEYSTMRLLVRREGNRLPDISDFSPKEIIRRDDNVFIIQFNNISDTADCYTYLMNCGGNIFVETDKWVEPLDTVSASGSVDSYIWGTDDPMGFDVYSGFIAQNGSGSVTIAVIDSGVSRHASYNSILRSDGINMLEAIDGQNWSADSARHGSVIASIIKDCAGNANVKILPIRVIGSDGRADYELIAEGIDYAVNNGAQIINLSMNFNRSAIVEYSIQKAINKGVTVVVAAGNSGRDISGIFPANMNQVITVSGIGPDYRLYNSNFGVGIDYCAPARYILTSAYQGTQEGTSFATPMICTAYALVKMDPYHTMADMRNTCTQGPADGSLPLSSAYGYGMPHLDQMAFIDPVNLLFNPNPPAIMKVDEQTELKCRVVPENATYQGIEIVSTDEEVISIERDGDGKVWAVAEAPGTATIRVTITGTTISVETTITVVQPVISIEIKGDKERLALGHTLTLTAVIQPSIATNPGIDWICLDQEFAEIDTSGVITPKKVGQARFVARAADQYGAQSRQITIQIINVPDPESVELSSQVKTINNNSVQMVPGETMLLVAKVLPGEAIQSVHFDAFPEDVITISDSGIITAIGEGTGYVNVSATEKWSVYARLTVRVEIPPDNIEINAPKTVMDIGEQVTLTAIVSPDNATNKTVWWRSTNESVMTVNNGKVTAVAPGTVNIIATTNANNLQGSITMTVRQPYTLNFNANGGTCAIASKIAYSGYAVGQLPIPTKDYCDFNGWYTSTSGGTKVTESSTFTSSSSITIYATWKNKAESDWVLPENVPANAQITQTSWSYRKNTEGESSTLSGWTANGYYWKQTATGSVEYASFPEGEYDTSNKYYKTMEHAARKGSETDTTKTTVVNSSSPTGYIYWHWAINGTYSSTAKRIIAYKKGTYSDGFWYGYFYAIKSTTKCPKASSDYCTSGQYPQNGRTTYDCRELIENTSLVPAADKTNSTSGLKTYRFYELPYYTSTYTNYVKTYKFYQEFYYQNTDPGNGSEISNKVMYVKYRNK